MSEDIKTGKPPNDDFNNLRIINKFIKSQACDIFIWHWFLSCCHSDVTFRAPMQITWLCGAYNYWKSVGNKAARGCHIILLLRVYTVLLLIKVIFQQCLPAKQKCFMWHCISCSAIIVIHMTFYISVEIIAGTLTSWSCKIAFHLNSAGLGDDGS